MARPTDSTNPTVDWPWLRNEVRVAAAAFADQLRAVPDDTVKVPNLEWSVRELAAHLAALPDFYRKLNDAPEPFERPDDWAEFADEVRRDQSSDDAATLADRIEAQCDALLAEFGDDGDATWNLYLPTTVAKAGAGYLSELLIHGRDLSALTGATVTIERQHALAIVPAMMTLSPYFIDREAARKCPGIYHLGFRGGLHYTYRMDDGILTVDEGRPDQADCRMLADPVAFVLVAMGRMSEVRAGLTGKLIAYGRKPWKFAALGNVQVEGI